MSNRLFKWQGLDLQISFGAGKSPLAVLVILWALIASAVAEPPPAVSSSPLGSEKNKDLAAKSSGAFAQEEVDIFAPLKEHLVKDGLPKEVVARLFSDPRVRFLPQIMPRKLTWDESKLPYQQFLRPERLNRARKFLEDYRPLLKDMEDRFGVEKEILVGLLLVESDLGRHHGRYEVFNVLASMAVSADWERVKPYLRRELSPEEETRLRRVMARRARWAYRELKVLLEISEKYGLDPLALKGSIFGAFGYPQFIPSSFKSYAVDGDGDGRIDLYTLTDALASAAHYLKRHGWREGLSREEKKRVIMTYNHSEPYAETILAIAERLRDSGKRN